MATQVRENINAAYIRKFAAESFVRPAKSRGAKTLSIPVRAVISDLTKKGLSKGRTPAICSALSGKKFQQENGLELRRFDGPRSGVSPTVIFHFDVAKGSLPTKADGHMVESPEQRAFRLTEKLRGLMKEEIAAHGGAEGYLRWVRGDAEV